METTHAESAAQRLVQRTQTLLAAHFHEPLTLADLACAVGCSTFHLAHAFRQHTGWTVHRWLLRLRLEAACAALARPEGVDDLTDLALELGFSSHSHFTKTFRDWYGAPPSRWRRAGMTQNG